MKRTVIKITALFNSKCMKSPSMENSMHPLYVSYLITRTFTSSCQITKWMQSLLVCFEPMCSIEIRGDSMPYYLGH